LLNILKAGSYRLDALVRTEEGDCDKKWEWHGTVIKLTTTKGKVRKKGKFNLIAAVGIELQFYQFSETPKS
jgi:hypothetical protein